jgi:hypothetical protein
MTDLKVDNYRALPNNHRANVKLLADLSKAVKPSVGPDGEYPTIKAAIMSLYKKGRRKEFKTMSQWTNDGFEIRDNAKAFLVWGAPRKETQSGKIKKIFPVVYLYANTQVKKVGTVDIEPELKLEVN